MHTRYAPIPRVFFAADFMLDPNNGLTHTGLVLALILQSHHARKTMYKSTNLSDLTGRDRKTLRGYLRKLREAGVVKEIYHPYRKDRILVARCPKTMLLWMEEREQAGEPVNEKFRAHLKAWIARVGDDVRCYKDHRHPIPWSCPKEGRDGYFVEQLNTTDEDVIKLARKHHTAIPVGLLTFRYLSFNARYVAIRLIKAKCYTWEDHTKIMQKLKIGRTMFETAIIDLREMGFVSGSNYFASKETRGINYNEACYRQGHYALSVSCEGMSTNYEMRIAAGLPVADVDPGDLTWLKLRLFVRELGETKAAFQRGQKDRQKALFEAPKPRKSSARNAPVVKDETVNPTQEKTPKPSCAAAQRASISFVFPGKEESEFIIRLARMGHYLNERLPGPRAEIGNRVAKATASSSRKSGGPGARQAGTRRAKRIKAEIANYPYAPGVEPPGSDGNYLTDQLLNDAMPDWQAQFIDWTPRLYDLAIRRLALGEKLSEDDSAYTQEFFNERACALALAELKSAKECRLWERFTFHGRPGWQTPKRLKYYVGNPLLREYFEDPSTLGNAFLIAMGWSANHWTDAGLKRVYRRILNGYINADVVCRMRHVGQSYYKRMVPEKVINYSNRDWIEWLAGNVNLKEDNMRPFYEARYASVGFGSLDPHYRRGPDLVIGNADNSIKVPEGPDGTYPGVLAGL